MHAPFFLHGRRVRHLAMNVGSKEKLLAALRGGIETVLIPWENEPELVEIPKNIKQHLDIKPGRWIDEVRAGASTEAWHKESQSLAASIFALKYFGLK